MRVLGRGAAEAARRARRHEGARGHVGRRRLLGRRRPAARGRPRRRRRHHEAVGRPVRPGLLLGRRRRRRPPGRRPARHRPPRLQLRRRLRRPRGRRPTSPPTPPGARRTLHRVQPAPQVRPPACAGRRRSASTPWPPATTPGSPTASTACRGCARGADAAKDQSYVLYMLGQDALAGVLLPVGDLTKAEVRPGPPQLGLRTAAKPDSQDVCFIRADAGRAGLPRRPHRRCTPGRVVDRAGAVVGAVAAVELVTVGQRRGPRPAPAAASPATSLDVDVPRGHRHRRRRRRPAATTGSPLERPRVGRPAPARARSLAQCQRPRRAPRRGRPSTAPCGRAALATSRAPGRAGPERGALRRRRGRSAAASPPPEPRRARSAGWHSSA